MSVILSNYSEYQAACIESSYLETVVFKCLEQILLLSAAVGETMRRAWQDFFAVVVF